MRMDRLKLLIVDDEIVVQQSCVDIFSEKGGCYEITTVSSGEEALGILEEKYFDIILTDIKMPGLPGLQLLSNITNKYPDTAIVVITGYATVRTAVEAMKLGAVDFIPKPFTPDEIYNAVENIASRIRNRKK
jgi:DNA-binding NtrC family response regulator